MFSFSHPFPLFNTLHVSDLLLKCLKFSSPLLIFSFLRCSCYYQHIWEEIKFWNRSYNIYLLFLNGFTIIPLNSKLFSYTSLLLSLLLCLMHAHYLRTALKQRDHNSLIILCGGDAAYTIQHYRTYATIYHSNKHNSLLSQIYIYTFTSEIQCD